MVWEFFGESAAGMFFEMVKGILQVMLQGGFEKISEIGFSGNGSANG